MRIDRTERQWRWSRDAQLVQRAARRDAGRQCGERDALRERGLVVERRCEATGAELLETRGVECRVMHARVHARAEHVHVAASAQARKAAVAERAGAGAQTDPRGASPADRHAGAILRRDQCTELRRITDGRRGTRETAQRHALRERGTGQREHGGHRSTREPHVGQRGHAGVPLRAGALLQPERLRAQVGPGSVPRHAADAAAPRTTATDVARRHPGQAIGRVGACQHTAVHQAIARE